MTVPSVFISYSHDSPEHIARVLAFSDRLRADGIEATLDQYELSPSEGWPRWMDKQIRKADFVLMICTEIYLRRVMGEEVLGKGLGVRWEGNLIYQHIYNADTMNARFIPILFDYSRVEHIPTPLQGTTHYRVDTNDGYEEIYRRLTSQSHIKKQKLGKLRELPPREKTLDFTRISLAKLPSTSRDFFGRDEELKALDDAWDNSQANIVIIVGWGGAGKSALVNEWLSRMGQDNYRGAERVYGWSFYSQGAAEGRQVSADQFIAAALTWFGDPDPTQGYAWDKGERLAELIQRRRTLLVLDGLEPLQDPSPFETGHLKDHALIALLRDLAGQNPGLTIITTRLAVKDIEDYEASTLEQIDLENLSPRASAAYLKHLGVKGKPNELKQAFDEFGRHALALTLMGRYLNVVHGGDISKRGEIPQVMDEHRQGAHARRVMEAYERWLQGKPELDILRLMGLFDRPVEKEVLDALRKEPAIDGLTDLLQQLKDYHWKYAVSNLRELRLISDPEPSSSETLDCHPLLREHFGEKLKAENLNAWREAHGRLYEYYKSSTKEYPDTIEEMRPLYAAVMHGCQAGRHQEALDDVYWRRIRRGQEAFNIHKLGAFGADLNALSHFFHPPWRQPVSALRDNTKGFILNAAGFDLRALGRLAEATQPMQAALQTTIDLNNWNNAARYSSNLSELYLTIGDVKQAFTYAEQSIQLADRSGNEFEQISDRTTLADALHQSGNLVEAQAAFHAAEEMQKKSQPEFSLLYSSPGYLYCDLLLSQGDYVEVGRRASQTLELGTKYLQQGGSLLWIALDNLSLGRAHLFKSQHDSNHQLTESLTYLNRAVDGLRQAGTQHHIPRALLARAEYYRVTGAFDKAQKDLDEAFSISARGGMGLFLVGCHLEYARLKIETFKGWSVQMFQPLNVHTDYLSSARQHLAAAKEMIAKMGYHRRDKEVQELEERLK